MVSEDWNQTSLLRLFHIRHNAGNSRSASQVFNMDIAVRGPSPAVEPGRTLAGRDAEHMKSSSHRNHPPDDRLSPKQVASCIQGTDIAAGNPQELLRGVEYVQAKANQALHSHSPTCFLQGRRRMKQGCIHKRWKKETQRSVHKIVGFAHVLHHGARPQGHAQLHPRWKRRISPR